MSNDTQVLDQNPGTPQAPVQPVVPVGSVSKETGPANVNLSEFVRPAGPEGSPNVSEEEKEAGVEVKSDKPNLTFEHKELGIDHAGPHVPVSASASGKVSLPMSEDEVIDKLKTGQDDDSGKWLSKLIQKIMKVMGL